MIYDIPTLIKEAEEMRWIPVEERLPDFDQYVLFCVASSGNYFIECLDKDGNPWMRLPGNEVTHWMLLPKGPGEK